MLELSEECRREEQDRLRVDAAERARLLRETRILLDKDHQVLHAAKELVHTLLQPPKRQAMEILTADVNNLSRVPHGTMASLACRHKGMCACRNWQRLTWNGTRGFGFLRCHMLRRKNWHRFTARHAHAAAKHAEPQHTAVDKPQIPEIECLAGRVSVRAC